MVDAHRRIQLGTVVGFEHRFPGTAAQVVRLHRGHARFGGVRHGDAKELFRVFHVVLAENGADLGTGVFADDAVGFTVGIAVDGAALGGDRVARDAGEAQGRGVGRQHVPAGALEDERIVRRDVVEVVAREHAVLVGEVVVIPPHAVEHGTGRRAVLLDVLERDALDVGDAARRVEAHVGERDPGVEEVLVRVVEAGHHRTAPGVPTFGVGGRCGRDFLERADGLDESVVDQDRFGEAAAFQIDVGVVNQSGHDDSPITIDFRGRRAAS